jgi:glc operon protein GlcG
MLVPEKKTLTLAAAKKIAEGAESFAAGNKWSVTIAVVDDGANLLYLERMDGALLGSVAIAQQKARTSALFRCPTKDFETGLADGGTSLLKLDILPYEGGIPIAANRAAHELIVGAIGVSGSTPAQDGQVAQAGIDWIRNDWLGNTLK